MALEQVIMRPRMTVVSGARRSVMYSLALRSDCSWNYWPHLFTAASAEFQGHRKSLSFSIQLKHLLVRNRKLSCRKKKPRDPQSYIASAQRRSWRRYVFQLLSHPCVHASVCPLTFISADILLMKLVNIIRSQVQMNLMTLRRPVVQRFDQW